MLVTSAEVKFEFKLEKSKDFRPCKVLQTHKHNLDYFEVGKVQTVIEYISEVDLRYHFLLDFKDNSQRKVNLTD